MKVTNTNIVEKWDEIEQYLNDKTHNTYNEFLPEDFTDPDMADLYEPFINDVNRQLANVTPQNKPEKKTEDKPKKDNKGKSDKPKKKRKTTGKKDTQNKKNKEKKPSKTKVGEAAPWQATLRRFASMCGEERTIAYIRRFVKEIQANFSAKLKRKTPHIELIREIQTKLLKYANSGEKKVSLPQWDDFKKQCQAAAREWTVSKTVSKPELKETSLSGLKKKRKKMCK